MPVGWESNVEAGLAKPLFAWIWRVESDLQMCFHPAVVVCSGDGDLTRLGGNHLIHAARRNIDLKVICVNNQIYAMTGGQTAATTPMDATTATSPYGSFEPALNLPNLVDAAGATYIARWTTYHVKQLEKSMTEVLKRKGFSFIEVISPCPTLYQRRNNMGDGLAAMKWYKEHSKTKHDAAARILREHAALVHVEAGRALCRALHLHTGRRRLQRGRCVRRLRGLRCR